MKRLYLIVAVVGTVSFALPQVTNAGWMKTYGGSGDDYGNWVEQTPDEGYIVAGVLRVSSDTSAICLFRTDSSGDTLWIRQCMEGGLGTWGECVQQTSDGGYIVAGSKELDEAWLIKTDPQGNVEWSRLYEDAEIAYCVRQMPDGGYVVTGETDSLYPGMEHRTTELWLMRTDAEGIPLWSRTYGEDYYDGSYSLQLTSDGGYIITGYKGIPSDEVDTGFRLWLLKTDEQGDTLWTRTYAFDENDTTHADEGYCVELTSDGGYVISGVVDWNPIGLGGALWLLKTDKNGDTLWTRTYGEEGRGLYDEGRCVQLTSDGGYIITGVTESLSTHGGADVWLIKTDSLGCVGIEEEPPVTPATHLSNWQIASSVGPQITLRYSDHPAGFHAEVFDAAGRKVDEVHSNLKSGTIEWGEGFNSGVYFFRVEDGSLSSVQKVVLIR